jgi:hypothetical protein
MCNLKRIAVFSVVLIYACSSNLISIDEITGDYEAKYGTDVQYLQILKDGNYIYRYFLDGEEILQSGTWEYEIFKGTVALTFYNIRLYDPTLPEDTVPEYVKKILRMKRKGMWIVEPERSFSGVITLFLDEDVKYSFKKIS